jgi:hypothetical protein
VAIYSYYRSYFANPNAGEAAKLPKNRFEQKWVKFVYSKSFRHTGGGQATANAAKP